MATTGAAGARGAARIAKVRALDDAATTAPNATERGALAKADRARDRAYKRGQRDARARAQAKGAFRRQRPDVGEPTGELQDLYDQGFRSGIREARRERVAGPVTSAGELVDDGAGVLLGAIGWALVLAYINYNGWAGVRGWIAAKFINRPLPKNAQRTPTWPNLPSAPTPQRNAPARPNPTLPQPRFP